jgi:membrane fusion protein, heavy metal efflux system
MGNVAATKAALTAAENRLHLLGMDQAAVETLAHTSEIDPKYVIRAPIDGQVTEREATLGELVGPDNDKLLVLANLGVVWVFADVPEAAVSNITLGAEAAITVAATGEEQFEGKIAHISPELDPSTRTARIRIEIPNPQMRLFPGMFARAEIHTGASDEPVIAIPADAIQTIEGDPSVFVPVRGEKNTFAKRQVGVGRPINGLVPVLAGLNEGDRYVVVGSFILKAELGKAGAAHEH